MLLHLPSVVSEWSTPQDDDEDSGNKQWVKKKGDQYVMSMEKRIGFDCAKKLGYGE
jgi:hypothetical protein